MAELNVSKKCVSNLFTDMQAKKFIIPDYQRPYKWDQEKCETLWQDLVTFYEENHEGVSEYYLGTVVTCKGDDPSALNDIEVIDGQQRITSFFLLLRAFYTKLEGSIEDDNIVGLKNQIAPCIWDVNSISGKVTDKRHIHIESRVATEQDNEVFHEILRTGNTDLYKTDLYSTNYRYFFDKCNEYAQINPTHWQPFLVTILKRCILLPIDCEKLDTALTIFSTLNDRGMPLSDSDIFKAQIYRHKYTSDEKNQFTKDWKDLTVTVEETGISLDDLFRYYTHVIRSRNRDKTKEIGLRKFYAGTDNKFLKLQAPNLIDEITCLAEFWLAISKVDTEIDGRIMFNFESQKYLHCLNHYPNEYWKYVTSVFFFANKDSPAFADEFPIFLRKIISFYFTQFIMNPSVNAIKDATYQFCVDLSELRPLKVSEKLPSDFSALMSQAVNYKIARAIILLHAYQNPAQASLLPQKFEIEHIFPQRWQSTNYFGWTQEDAEVYMEKFGNKVAIEKKLNIQAGNGYFGRKKDRYRSSNISNVLNLSNYEKDDWAKEDIESREQAFLENITEFFSENLEA